MKIKTMKFCDKYLGWLGCAILTFWVKIANVFGLRKKVKPVKNSLAVMKFWGMGSIILATPLVRSLKDRFLSAKLIFVTLERNRRLLDSLGLVDEVITLDVDRGWLRFAVSFAKMVVSLRRARLDAICDLEFFTRFSSIVSYLSGAPLRAGYHSFSVWRGDLHNMKVPFNRYWHVVDNFYNIGQAFGISRTAQEIPSLVCPSVQEADERYVKNLLSDVCGLSVESVGNKPIIVMHANASELALERRWPYTHFARLVDMISGHMGKTATVIFIGSKEERQSVEEIKSLLADSKSKEIVFNFAGKLNIKQLTYLLKKMSFGVFNDSGPLHLAVACGGKTVSLFGPETPVIYGPPQNNRDSERHIIFFKDIDCSPCVNVHDGKTVKCSRLAPECLTGIAPEEVFNAIKDKGWL